MLRAYIGIYSPVLDELHELYESTQGTNPGVWRTGLFREHRLPAAITPVRYEHSESAVCDGKHVSDN